MMTKGEKPHYFCHVYIEDEFYIIKVEYVRWAPNGKWMMPVGYVTQARSGSEVEHMAKDLIATVLDVNTSEFDVTVMFTGGVRVDQQSP